MTLKSHSPDDLQSLVDQIKGIAADLLRVRRQMESAGLEHLDIHVSKAEDYLAMLKAWSIGVAAECDKQALVAQRLAAKQTNGRSRK